MKQRFLEIIGTQNIIFLQQEKSLSAFSIRSCRRARCACYSERQREGERERYNNKKRRPRRRSPLSPGTPNRCADGTRRIPHPSTATDSAVQRLQKCLPPKNARLRIAGLQTKLKQWTTQIHGSECKIRLGFFRVRAAQLAECESTGHSYDRDNESSLRESNN